jgi:beta-barrel assembly-enhancing protease
MKRWLTLAGIVAVGVAAVVVSERRKVDAPTSPAALLYLIADTEKELTRMPVSFTRMSDEDEVRIGNEIAKSYIAARADRSDAEVTEIQAYVTQVGSRLATKAHRKLAYTFHYIPEKYFVNAFALPGGHVYIGEGLLALMDSEDELAAVLGHEVEHIDHYHCAERVQQEQALRKIPLAELFVLPIEIFQAGYSKDQELEADREGTRLVVEAGYSANGAIRMFETFQRLYEEYHTRAKTPADELSQVAIDALEGYFRSHPLPAERIAQVNKMIASEGWAPRAEHDLGVAYIFWMVRAQEALSAGKYSQAQQLAARSLQTRPNLAKALTVLAQAEFARADFAGATASYRKILEARGWNIDLADSYALSLAAADRPGAANEFRRWMASAKGDTRELQVPLGGLLLLGGDAAAARKLQAEIRANPENPSAPGELSDLGGWWYMGGDYTTAAEDLHEAIQRRPGNIQMLLRLAWTQIELRRFADALQTLNAAPQENTLRPELLMAHAVVRWQAQQPDIALRDLEAAATSRPEWENLRWVKALYSPLVAQSIQEMQVERERRRKTTVAARP